MKTASVREFRLKTSRYLGGTEEILVTRRGKTIGMYTPVPAGSPRAAMLEIGKIFREAGITKADALRALEEARREIYGPRRS